MYKVILMLALAAMIAGLGACAHEKATTVTTTTASHTYAPK